MRNITLFADGTHKFILLNETEGGEEEGIHSNQYLITDGECAVLMDPGGFGVMPRVLAELLRHTTPKNIKAIILSHQDPDIVGGLTTWLEITDCPAYVSRIWLRFLPHYGIGGMSRFIGVPDEGMPLDISPGFKLHLLPAHFLHSEGQINVYDSRAKILFSGDIGAAMMPEDKDYAFVDDLAIHLPYIEGFHRRYMSCNRAARFWVDTVSALDIHMIAPQHGPVYRGPAVTDFLAWMKELQCGTDLMIDGGHFQTGNA
ncbi:MAG TPA: MBL fold metallo-hydrolase [Methylococcaceae bacterium]|nr:MBL fold metallo-hydrolase [Methylococcaceae bacterium]